MKPNFLVAGLLTGLVLFALTRQSSLNAQPSSRTISVTASRFSFSPAELTVKKGEPITIVLTSRDVTHGLRFRELNVDIRADKGKSSEKTFTPETAGDFIGRCSVFCGSGHRSMTLTLHVVN